MNSKSLHEQIMNLFDTIKCPLTLTTISNSLNYSHASTIRTLQELIKAGKVKELTPENNSAEKYYMPTDPLFLSTSSPNHESVTLKNIEQKLVNTLSKYNELSKEIENSQKQLKSIYANIISIMSIFVSIFALITVNGNIVFSITQENLTNYISGIILVNIFVIICIISLLLAIKFLIINGLNK